MPRLPSSIDLGERPDIRPSGGVASYGVQRSNEGAIIASAGQSISHAGDQFFAMVKEEEQRIDTTKAEEAYNKLRERQLDLTIGDENGFANKHGADAINQPLLKDYSAKFEQASKEIEATLGNDNQRELFRKRAGVSGLQFKEELLRHLHREGDTYAKQVYDGGVNVEVRNATARWQDPLAVQLSVARIEGLIDQEADRGGWSPEQKDAERLKRVSQVHSAVIGQALATNNYQFAQKWYEANKDDIDPVTAKAVQKAVEDGTQKQTYADYTRGYLGVQDDAKGLSDLHGKVLGDPTLDDTRKNALLGRIQARMGVLENRANHERDKLNTRLQKAINEQMSNVRAGFEPSAEQLAPILNAAKGTDLEGDAARLVASANATRAFRNSLPAAQEQMLTRAEAAIREDPTKFDRQLLESWRTIHETQKTRVKENPVGFLVQQGVVDPKSDAAKPLDLSKPDEAATVLQARFELARAAQKAYGAPLKPATPEEVSLFVGALKGGTVAQKRDVLTRLANASNGDYEGYSAVLAQIAPDAPVVATAGEFAGKGRNQVADLLLRGDSILRPNRKEDGSPDQGKLLPMPAEKDMRRIFDDQVRDAFAGMPNARNGHFQAARAIYAALSADAGDRDTSILDTKRWEQSIEMATGGFANYGGRRVPLPYGQDFSQFKDGLVRRVEDMLERGTLEGVWTKSKLLDLPLEAAGDGKYKFKIGDADLVDKQGNVVKVDFSQPAAFRTSGYGLKAAAEEPTPAELEQAEKPFLGPVGRKRTKK